MKIIDEVKLKTILEKMRMTKHYECYDSWYSCPKHPDYVGEFNKDECDCGMESQNERIDNMIKEFCE